MNHLCIISFLSKNSYWFFCFPISITDLEYGNKSRRKKAYNLRTRKLQPQVFDSDSEGDFQASRASTSGICNKSLQREEGTFLIIYLLAGYQFCQATIDLMASKEPDFEAGFKSVIRLFLWWNMTKLALFLH